MAREFSDADKFLAALVEMAEELRAILIPMSDVDRSRHAMTLVGESEMVFGVWPRSQEEAGFGILVIKGGQVLPPLSGFEMPYEIKMAAIPCVGRAQALAAREAWGGSEQETEAAEDSPDRSAIANSGGRR
jgi:hypothetical protein